MIVPEYSDEDPVAEAAEDEVRRRERVYLAISNHVNEIMDTYVKRGVLRHLERMEALLAERADAVARGEAPPEVSLAPRTQARTRRNLQAGRDILAGLTEILFTAAIRDGYLRFPNGYGSFKVVRSGSGVPKRLPTGKLIAMSPDRVRFRYEEGAAVREALGLAPKTSYVRRFQRELTVSKDTQALLDYEGGA